MECARCSPHFGLRSRCIWTCPDRFCSEGIDMEIRSYYSNSVVSVSFILHFLLLVNYRANEQELHLINRMNPYRSILFPSQPTRIFFSITYSLTVCASVVNPPSFSSFPHALWSNRTDHGNVLCGSRHEHTPQPQLYREITHENEQKPDSGQKQASPTCHYYL